MQGIEGFDPVGNFINEYPAEKTEGTEIALKYFNNWFPIDSKKHACCGKLTGFQTYDGGGAEMDWNIYISPNDEFKNLIADVIKYRDSDDQWNYDKKTGSLLLEGEITPQRNSFP